MSSSAKFKEVADALVEGMKDHGPMTIEDAIAFLNGYGFDFTMETGPGYVRQAIHHHKDLFFKDLHADRTVTYSLKEQA